MHTGKGQVLELILEDGSRYLRLACPSQLTPAPGQYLLAGDSSDSPLPVPLFYTDSAPYGFIAAHSGDASWSPGTELNLRGPLGHGFSLPSAARRVCLVAFEESPAHLKGLIRPALHQAAAVVLVCSSSSDALPDEVEVHPFVALHEALEWADYVALSFRRQDLNGLREQLGKGYPGAAGCEGQMLIHTPVPCGGMADCGICAVTLRSGWKLACKEGPVFDWKALA